MRPVGVLDLVDNEEADQKLEGKQTRIEGLARAD